MISITLTLDELEAHDACEEGIALFRSISLLQGSSDGTVLQIIDWTRLHAVWLLRDGPAATDAQTNVYKWLVGQGLIPRADLSGADLRGADLSGTDLRGADLSGADLSWAGLSGADLSWAGLSGADLRGAGLSGADLSWAGLSGADLSGADLRGADLSGADLSWAGLSGADLSWAGLSGARRSSSDTPISGWRSVDGRLQRES